MTSKLILLTICFFLFSCSSEDEIPKKKIISILNSNVVDRQYFYFEGNGFFTIKDDKKSKEQNSICLPEVTIKRESNKLTFVSIKESYHPIFKTWAPKIPSCFGGGTGKYITFPIQDSVYVLDGFKDTASLDTVVKLFHKLQKNISE